LGLGSLREDFIARRLPSIRALLEDLKGDLAVVEEAVAAAYGSPRDLEPAALYELLANARDLSEHDEQRLDDEWREQMRTFAETAGPRLGRLLAIRDLDRYLRAGGGPRYVDDRLGVVVSAAMPNELWNERAVRVWRALRREAERRFLRVLVRAKARQLRRPPMHDDAEKLIPKFDRLAEAGLLAARGRGADLKRLAEAPDRSELVSVDAVRTELIDLAGAVSETGLAHEDVMAGIDAIGEDALRRDLWKTTALTMRGPHPKPHFRSPTSPWEYLALFATTFVGQKVDDLKGVSRALRQRYYEKTG